MTNRITHSDWLKADLHIHSHASNKTKANDYDGSNLTFESLTTALKKENVRLFSITDHNTVNIELYRELIARKEELFEKNMNFLIGVELDFNDAEIHTDTFHMLVYFDTESLNDIEEIFKILYEVDSLDKLSFNQKPIASLGNFFEIVFKNNIPNIITIPHFNKKHKGIPPKDEINSLVYTVFSALEDSNNRKNLTKSLKYFKEESYNDVPLVVFSDNHDIAKYPEGKNGCSCQQTCLHLLGNIHFPFSSVKTAFQDVNTRVSIESIDELRQRKKPKKYIEKITFGNDEELNLSPYQNTIIGGFGSGKSFLLNLICEGKNNLNNEKGYKALAEQYGEVKVNFSDDSSRQSLSELANDLKIIKFDQYKDIYFENIILEEKKNTLGSVVNRFQASEEYI